MKQQEQPQEVEDEAPNRWMKQQEQPQEVEDEAPQQEQPEEVENEAPNRWMKQQEQPELIAGLPPSTAGGLSLLVAPRFDPSAAATVAPPPSAVRSQRPPQELSEMLAWLPLSTAQTIGSSSDNG